MKKWNRALNAIMITAILVFLQRIIVDFVYFNILHPEIYVTYSAPWYTAGLVYGLFALIVLLICFAVKLILRRKCKKSDK